MTIFSYIKGWSSDILIMHLFSRVVLVLAFLVGLCSGKNLFSMMMGMMEMRSRATVWDAVVMV